jgi:hypothetical protein
MKEFTVLVRVRLFPRRANNRFMLPPESEWPQYVKDEIRSLLAEYDHDCVDLEVTDVLEPIWEK